MAGFMMAWAIVSTLTCLVKDYHGMLVCRLILGFVEAPFYPGALFMIAQFYNRKEATTRMAVLYTGNMLASAFSGLIAAGVFAGLDQTRARWMAMAISDPRRCDCGGCGIFSFSTSQFPLANSMAHGRRAPISA